jgi:uncharacterized membrane protein YkvA (DUF1232 family)
MRDMAKATRRKTPKKAAASGSTAKQKRKPAASVVIKSRRQPIQEKAAIRSDAFAKAILEAKSYTADPKSLQELFQEASAKAAGIPNDALNELGPYLQTMLRLIRAYAAGDYRNIAKDALLTIVAAVSYLVDPFDLIPDEIPFLGYVDDATVISFAVSRTRGALDDFIVWETRA